MVFWSSWAKKVRDAITRKEFNTLKEQVNDNTNNISTNSNAINGLSNDISNIGNRVNTNTNNITTNSNNINSINTTISQVNNKINNLEQTKADKTQLDNYYTKTQSDARYLQSGNYYNKQECDSRFVNNQKLEQELEDKLLAVYATTIRNVRSAPQVQAGSTGFWFCDFETNLYMGDNNFHSIDIAGIQILNSQNQWVCLKPLKWYFNGGRVGVVLYTTTQYDINGVANGADVDIWVNKSNFFTNPTKTSNSVYKE